MSVYTGSDTDMRVLGKKHKMSIEEPAVKRTRNNLSGHTVKKVRTGGDEKEPLTLAPSSSSSSNSTKNLPSEPKENLRILSKNLLKTYREQFQKSEKNLLMRDALTDLSIKKLARSHPIAIKAAHVFSDTISIVPKAADQQHSGRCWMFSGLNLMRSAMIKKYDLPKSFEFSQAYLFFCDKMEKSNIFLNQIIDHSDEPVGTDTMRWILESPLSDGGYWTMFTNLVDK